MWRRFLNAIGISRYETNLAKVNGLARVRIIGRVASDNIIVSPVTSMRASLMRFALGQRRQFEEHLVDDVFGETFVFEQLLIESGDFAIVIPRDVKVHVEFQGSGLAELVATSALPQAIRHLQAHHTCGPLLYAEQTLRNGDPVELLAWVEPARIADLPAAAGNYRSSGSTNGFRVVNHKGIEARIRDRSLDEL